MNHKTLAILLTGIILLVAACGGQPSPEPTENPTGGTDNTIVPDRPSITMGVLGEEHAGLAGAYCWPQAADDIRCEPDPLDPQPDESIPVQTGDEIEFMVSDDAGAPSALAATILGSTDADGDPLAINFGPTNSGVYTVDLDSGEQALSVVAEFQNIEGDNSFITYYFTLDVTAEVVEAVTPRPSATAPAEDEEPTAEGPVAIPTKGGTADEATPTQEMMETEPTDEAGDVVAVPTKEGDDEEETAEPTAVVIQITATDEPVEPTNEPTATTMPTVEPTTALPPTTAPSPVSATNVPPTLAPTAESAGSGNLPSPPEIVVINGGRTYHHSGVEYCTRSGGSQVCVEMPATINSERILLNNGNTLRIDAADEPQAMTIALTSNDLSQVLSSLELPGSSIALYTVTAEQSGNYMLRIDADWGDGTATYYFRLQIVG